METTRELLGERIKELCKRKGLTQEQLAEKVDLATSYISLIEVGRSSPTLETIENIASTLEVELKDLFDYMQLDPERVAPKELGKSLEEIDEASRKLLYRIARLMAR